MDKEDAKLLILTMIHGHVASATKLIHRLEALELDPVKDWRLQTMHDHLAGLEIHPDHRELRGALEELERVRPGLDKHL
jgi:hypothetical protein